jgi:hypothetical protein
MGCALHAHNSHGDLHQYNILAAGPRGWGIAQAMLSAWWSVEDHGHGWEPMVALAEMLQQL